MIFRNRRVAMLSSYLSITNLVSVAFLAYMGNSIFTLGKFWFPETCPEGTKDSKCYRAMKFEPDDKFTVEVYTTNVKRASSNEKSIFMKTDFDLNLPVFEEKVNITLPKEIVSIHMSHHES